MDAWQYLPSKIVPGMDKASWPERETNFDNAGSQLTGFNRPTRYQGEMRNLEWLNGDGAISSFRIKDGNVDFKQRFVQTEKFRVEEAENRALLGKYRNPWTDLVEFADRTTANTTALPYKGMILALKEDSRPYAIEPRTLETIGSFDFDGQLESETFTAHPKYDVKTRELLAFGYEGKGIGSKDVFYMSINEHGKFTERLWFEAPFCGFQHDMAFTDNWVNGFGFFPDKDGKAPRIEDVPISLNEWVIDPQLEKLVLSEPKQVVSETNEFPRIDDRLMGQKNRVLFGMLMDFSPGVTDWEYSAPRMGSGIIHMNTLYKKDNVTGELRKYHRGNRHFFQEPQFIPRHPDAPEGDGFLIALVNNLDDMISELVIIDCNNFEEHAALAKLPVRLRPGFHGNWVDDADIDGRPTQAPKSFSVTDDGNGTTNGYRH
ncbi:hypothetical protein Daus18300_014213 [Diaporthe australafricana]|uniref:Dioxygenase n=1 Tax=Diaporthe australafricana TaxID=127596 RepID=A0ABR3VW43_9PEZI